MKLWNNEVRETGFRRFCQLLSIYAWDWLKINFITLTGLIPFLLVLWFALPSVNVILLITGTALGGAVFGPFLSGLYDSILRGLRDDPRPWLDNYIRSWKQNVKDSLLPGAVLGMMLGAYSLIGMRILVWSSTGFSIGSVISCLFALAFMMILISLYWPQIVLFQQKPAVRLRNCVLIFINYPFHVLGIGALQLIYWLMMVLLAPISLAAMPVLGIWFISFLTQYLMYDRFNHAFHVEELYQVDRDD